MERFENIVLDNLIESVDKCKDKITKQTGLEDIFENESLSNLFMTELPRDFFIPDYYYERNESNLSRKVLVINVMLVLQMNLKKFDDDKIYLNISLEFMQLANDIDKAFKRIIAESYKYIK